MELREIGIVAAMVDAGLAKYGESAPDFQFLAHCARLAADVFTKEVASQQQLTKLCAGVFDETRKP